MLLALRDARALPHRSKRTVAILVKGVAGPGEGSAEDAFEVELRRTGTILTVPADRTVLQAARDVVPDVLYSCEEGSCGSCEAVVLAGEPEHLDTVLSEAEREKNQTMMICVSRSRSGRLVLDL
ncbi:2Fe-2S iron-sulfur cluster binding domain-containing protein [Cryptosporangium arvum]|uniref:2Fe-2S iron-sulfur cluster-binding protein n=1 Tax=Cryptosporangium arvum TaxID=80871 RepID=UPI000686A879|nr:2Fe-2S iron-sulfur cluster binding domain-containing protein [Cryptosporangium arvum]